MRELERMGRLAREASALLARLGADEKRQALKEASSALLAGTKDILTANIEDVEAARRKGMAPGLVDRLMLDEDPGDGGRAFAGGRTG